MRVPVLSIMAVSTLASCSRAIPPLTSRPRLGRAHDRVHDDGGSDGEDAGAGDDQDPHRVENLAYDEGSEDQDHRQVGDGEAVGEALTWMWRNERLRQAVDVEAPSR